MPYTQGRQAQHPGWRTHASQLLKLPEPIHKDAMGPSSTRAHPATTRMQLHAHRPRQAAHISNGHAAAPRTHAHISTSHPRSNTLMHVGQLPGPPGMEADLGVSLRTLECERQPGSAPYIARTAAGCPAGAATTSVSRSMHMQSSSTVKPQGRLAPARGTPG